MQDEPENQEDQTQDPTTEEVEAQTETPAPDDDDPDAQALKDALAEAEAEEAAAKQAVENAEKEAQPEKSEAAPETKDGDKAAETKPDAGEQPMIPKARFDEVADRANRASAQVLYLQGQLEAYRSGQKTEPKAEEPTPETTIDELEAQRDAIWKKADDGDLTLSEARKQERALDRRIAEIERAAQPKPEEKPGPAGQDLYLREKTAEIQRQHPYVGKINALPEADQDAAWSFLEKKAEAAIAETARAEIPDVRQVLLEDLRGREKYVWAGNTTEQIFESTESWTG